MNNIFYFNNKLRLYIFYINDLHSRFEQLTLIKSLLRKYQLNFSLYFDIGVNVDFIRIETIGTKGMISTVLLDYLGCGLPIKYLYHFFFKVITAKNGRI